MRAWILSLVLLLPWGGAQTSPSPSQTNLALGVRLYALGQYEAAMAALERALREKPNDPETLYWMARTQLRLGLLNPALENAKALVARNPRYIGGYMVLAEAYLAFYWAAQDREKAQGYLDQALSVLQDAERVNPRYAPIFAQRGILYALKGQPDRAEASLKRALELSDEPGVRAALAEVYLKMGRLEEALDQYAQAVAKDPKNEGLRVRYASALLLKNQPQRAAQVLEEGHRQKPLGAEGWYTLGQAYLALGQPKNAGVALENAVALAPLRFPQAYAHLGRIYMELGDYPKAKSRYTVAVKLDPQNPEYRLGLCLANEKLGDREGARYQCQEVLRLRPGLKEAEEVLKRL